METEAMISKRDLDGDFCGPVVLDGADYGVDGFGLDVGLLFHGKFPFTFYLRMW